MLPNLGLRMRLTYKEITFLSETFTGLQHKLVLRHTASHSTSSFLNNGVPDLVSQARINSFVNKRELLKHNTVFSAVIKETTATLTEGS
jgi:hypothetical protein